MKLTNKIALVTGGNSGIGLGIALKLNDEGASGFIVGRNTQTLEAASQALSGNFSPIQCDVTDQSELDSLFSSVEQKMGKLDILVVNAGGAIGQGSIQPFEQFDEATFDAMTALNFKSVFFTIQKALPYLNDNASIILISSIAIHKGFPGMSVYATSKVAVRSLAKTLSVELMSRGIRVNVVSPGTIDTPVFDKLGLPAEAVEQVKAQFTDQIPLGRIGLPTEIGSVVAFLASPEASFIIGEEIIVDGGVVNL